MISIKPLFDETQDELSNIPKKYLKRINRKCKYITDSSTLPDITHPEAGTRLFEKDIADLKHHFHNPCLANNFLIESDSSVETVFENYCEQNGLDVNWKAVKDVCKDVDTIVLGLKYKYNRLRPKEFLLNDSIFYDTIRDTNSPSFPSGHTAIAYFVSSILSNEYPEESKDFQTLSELIGQSRIENGVHFPSDVLYGRLVGEMLADIFINSSEHIKLKSDISKKDKKRFSSFLRSLAVEKYNLGENSYKPMCEDIANFICATNKIENVQVDYSDAMEASKLLMSGYDIDRISNNHNITSQFAGMLNAYKHLPVNSPYKIVAIHRSFNPSILKKGKPGELRNFEHSSPHGHEYCDYKDIFRCLRKVCDVSDPKIKHILYEWVHPFLDGNGRSGRLIMLADTDFDFELVNDFINDKYIDCLSNYMSEVDIRSMLL
jgi:hypothetical protein